jgi:plastocyanin/heme-degrading monooxygenase HmoA
MEYIRAVLVQIPADRVEEASRPDGLLAELDGHRSHLQQQTGFRGMRITRSSGPEGDMLLAVETRWQDESALAEYAAREPSVTSIIDKHRDVTVANSLQVSDAPATEATPAEGRRDVSERLVLPLLIPMGIFVFAVLVIYGLSRIYLEIPNDVATPLALGIAIAILAVSWYLASNPQVPRWQIGGIVLVAVGLLLGGGIYAGVHEDKGEGAEAAPPAAEAPAEQPTRAASPVAGEAAAVLDISAINITYSTDTLEAPADKPFIISFENQENLPHNVSIYTDDTASDPLFVGDIFSGPDTRDYEVSSLPPGQYFFRCDVHPTQMTGTLIVK